MKARGQDLSVGGQAPWPLQPKEKAYFSYEASHPPVSFTIGGVVLAQGAPPTIDEIRGLFQARLHRLPQLSWRLGDGPLRNAMWVPDSDIALDELIQEQQTTSGGDDGLRDAVHKLLNEPLDRSHPLWRVRLIHGYADDEFALFYLGHHALHDGASIAKAMVRIFLGDNQDDHRVPPPRPKLHRPGPLALIRGAVNTAQGCFPQAKITTERVDPTGERRIAWTFIGRDRLEAAGRRHGTSANIAYLTGVTEVLREWPHSPWHHLPDEHSPIWAMQPVSTRGGGGHYDELVHRAGAFRVQLPCHQPEASDRLAALTQHISWDTLRTQRDAGHAFSNAMPYWLLRPWLNYRMSHRYTHLAVTNVPGLQRPVRVLGRVVRGMVPVNALPLGHRLGAALTTYHDHACITFITDAQYPDVETLPEIWRRTIEDLASQPTTSVNLHGSRQPDRIPSDGVDA